mgnify:CR=1 FL=1
MAVGQVRHEPHVTTHRFVCLLPLLAGVSVVFCTPEFLPVQALCAPLCRFSWVGLTGRTSICTGRLSVIFLCLLFPQPERIRHCSWHNAALEGVCIPLYVSGAPPHESFGRGQPPPPRGRCSPSLGRRGGQLARRPPPRLRRTGGGSEGGVVVGRPQSPHGHPH